MLIACICAANDYAAGREPGGVEKTDAVVAQDSIE
jgi:hypothetical protein